MDFYCLGIDFFSPQVLKMVSLYATIECKEEVVTMHTREGKLAIITNLWEEV